MQCIAPGDSSGRTTEAAGRPEGSGKWDRTSHALHAAEGAGEELGAHVCGARHRAHKLAELADARGTQRTQPLVVRQAIEGQPELLVRPASLQASQDGRVDKWAHGDTGATAAIVSSCVQAGCSRCARRRGLHGSTTCTRPPLTHPRSRHRYPGAGAQRSALRRA